MNVLKLMGIDHTKASIRWDITPADTFGMFESWGGKERVRHKDERFYYFYIENSTKPSRLCLMERGIKHARVLARIKAPQNMIDDCVASQGKSTTLDSSYSIDGAIRRWLEKNVIDSADSANVVAVAGEAPENLNDPDLHAGKVEVPGSLSVALRSTPKRFEDHEIEGLVRQGNFYDSQHHPQGYFQNCFVDNHDKLTVTDKVSNLMWMRHGRDINSIRTIVQWVENLNRESFAGCSDWRLPTIEEGLTLLEKHKNDRGLYIRPCFSALQPFIFTIDKRLPGGHWFIDFTQARVYWGSGFNPGGFGRVCRSIP
jgi:hypothetical protein